jgi:hypothetical protein
MCTATHLHPPYPFKAWTRTVFCFIHIKYNALKDTRTEKVKWKDNLNIRVIASFKNKTKPGRTEK